jgi:hypothetical protein
MIITLFGSCRQHSIRNHYIVTDIQENLTYPHYTKEVIQAITYCKGTHAFDNSLTQHCFRAGILHKRPILYQKELQRQFENTDVFVVEIASRIAYEWNGLYVHHILTEEQYGFHDISNIRQRDLTDDEIEADLLTIKRELYPKKLLVVPHVYTRTHGKRYELVQLLERLCYKHDIPFMNPSARTQHIQGIYENEQAFHYTPTGHALIGQHYKEVIETICQKKTVILVWKQEYADVPRRNWRVSSFQKIQL